MSMTARLTITEAAARCGLSEKSLRRLINRGELPADRVSGRILIDPADLTKVPQGALIMSAEQTAIEELADALRGAGFDIPTECRDVKSVAIAVQANSRRRPKQEPRDEFDDGAPRMDYAGRLDDAG